MYSMTFTECLTFNVCHCLQCVLTSVPHSVVNLSILYDWLSCDLQYRENILHMCVLGCMVKLRPDLESIV